VWTTAREVCIKIQDGTHFSPKNQTSNGKYPYVTAKNIRPSGLDLSKLTYLKESDHRAIYQRCDPKKGDVLLVKDGANTGDAAINTFDQEISLLSSVCLLRAHPGILSSDFLRYFLLSPIGAGLLKGKMTGTAIKRIVLAHVKELPVPVAPVAEQERVVAEIDKQLTRLDTSVKALKRVRANLKRYRASILKAACEGRLVSTEAELARAEGRDYEPADVLVARILKERQAAWEERELSKTARARPPSKGAETRSKYREPASISTSDLPALPSGWLWVGIEALLSEPMCNGISVKGSNKPPGVPALKLNAMTDRGFLYDAVRYIPISKPTAEDLNIVAGDFFVARGNGSVALVGRGTRAQEPPFEVVFPDTMIRLRFVPSASTDWVPTIWPSALVRRQIQSKIKTTAGIWKIAQPQVASIVVPLPPLAEQQRIVADLQRRLSVIEEPEALVAANLKRAEHLRQSILKSAFEGRLVPQDPNDEPASVLLERIRAERKATGERAPSREHGNGTQKNQP
jgi:type I restriction enzyme S subunit